MQFFFVWLDGHPARQVPLDLEVEVFAVNKELEIRPSRRFRITDAMRATSEPRQTPASVTIPPVRTSTP